MPGIDRGSIDLSPRAMYGIATVFLKILDLRSLHSITPIKYAVSFFIACRNCVIKNTAKFLLLILGHSIIANFGFVAHFYGVIKDESSVHISAVKL